MKMAVFSLMILSTVVASCSNAYHNSIHRTSDLQDNTIARTTLIDAKQRALFTAPGVDNPNSVTRKFLICAEPSPDTVSSLSSAFETALNAGKFESDDTGTLKISEALSEAVGKLGKRNATIQLLRDGLYRQCEAYLNGVISRDQYVNISNRYVDAMVTLLAIEQVTSPDAGDGFLILGPSNASANVLSLSGKEESDESESDDINHANIGTQTGVFNVVHSRVDGEVAREVKDMLGAFLQKNLLDKCFDKTAEVYSTVSTERTRGDGIADDGGARESADILSQKDIATLARSRTRSLAVGLYIDLCSNLFKFQKGEESSS